MKTEELLKRVRMAITTHLDYSEDSMDDLRKFSNDALDLADEHGDEIPEEKAAALLMSLRHKHE